MQLAFGGKESTRIRADFYTLRDFTAEQYRNLVAGCAGLLTDVMQFMPGVRTRLYGVSSQE